MPKTIGVALALVAVIATGCARVTDDGSGSTGGDGTGGTGSNAISHPTGADELVMRIAYEGGFVPFEYTLSSQPMWSLFGDGTILVTGPQIEIYPPPAITGLVATHLTEDGVQAILRAARDAGLMDGDASYGNDCIADAATTVFTTNADGSTSVVSAYALELGDPGGACGETDPAARAKLADFQMKLGDLQGWLPPGSIGPEEPYEPTEMRVFVLPYRGEPDLPQAKVEWPLSEDLETFGSALADAPTETRCGVVSGEDLHTLLAAAGSTNQLTPWTSGGSKHLLLFRPLLPDEHGC